LCLHKPSILHRSLSVLSLCFPSPWFVSSQTKE
jgi:tRNA G46 methylase TrmB